MSLKIAKRLETIKDGGLGFDRLTINRPLKKLKSINRPTGRSSDIGHLIERKSIDRRANSIERLQIFRKNL